ncbi:MAG: hypothetical protein WAL98_07720 [Desulfatiglandaceae bacterium]
MYGAWHINMPKEVRKCIRIDGEPACELDYKAHHIRMLYHEMGVDYREDLVRIHYRGKKVAG